MENEIRKPIVTLPRAMGKTGYFEGLAKLNFKIDKIDPSLVHKPQSLGDANEWVLQVYKQFGFNSFEEIKAFALKYEKYGWMNLFYWSKETEANFLREIIKFYPSKRKQMQITKYYQEASLNWFPINGLELWQRTHEEVKKDEFFKEDKK